MTTSSYPIAYRIPKYSGLFSSYFCHFKLKLQLILILTTMSCSFPLIADQQQTAEQAELTQKVMYLFYDEHGNQVFSDTKPINQHFVAIEIKEVATLNWVPTQSLPAKKTRAFSRPSPVVDKSDQICNQLSKKIEKLNNQLRAGLSAQQFDRVKSELIDKRWQYKKNC